jgi:RimJ/RimL family protein N-acetyltransferase
MSAQAERRPPGPRARGRSDPSSRSDPSLPVPPPPPLHITGPLQTERLLLRLFTSTDLEAVYDMQSRPEVARYLYWSPRSRTEAADALKEKLRCRSIKGDGDILNLAVERLTGGPVIGDLMLRYVSATHRQAEIGYIFHPDAQGQGFATEATRALTDLAFSELKVHRVFGQIDGRNTASARVLERLGMRREAQLVENEWVKGEWTDEVIYAVLADEWARSRPPDA